MDHYSELMRRGLGSNGVQSAKNSSTADLPAIETDSMEPEPNSAKRTRSKPIEKAPEAYHSNERKMKRIPSQGRFQALRFD